MSSPTNSKKPLIGAYYYPWYIVNFHGGKYLRGKHLDPPQPPSLGEYQSSDPQVIAQHVEWSQRANIEVWLSSWWGPNSGSDKVLRNHVLPSPHVSASGLKIALLYESSGRLGKDLDNFANATSDIVFMAENYFSHPSYLKIDGRPVLELYISRGIARKGDLAKVVHLMREAARSQGLELYIIGDHAFGSPPDPTNKKGFAKKSIEVGLLDAITNYDVYAHIKPSDGVYTTQENVDYYTGLQSDWKKFAHNVSTAFVPCVSPGFNDRGVRLEAGHNALARNLSSSTPEEGSLFRSLLDGAIPQIDEGANCLLLITSFNEWHEDTQIEPVDKKPPTDQETEYTQGIDYPGYGTLYLDILRDMST